MHRVHIDFTRPLGKWFPIFAWGVQLFERTRYSHVRIRWMNSVNSPRIYEASGSRVSLIGKYAAAQMPVKIYHSYTFELDEDQYKDLIKLLDYSHLHYGVWQIVGIAIARIFNLKKNPLSSGKDTLVCSELVALFLNEVIGLNIPKEQFDLIGPRGIKEILDKHFNEQPDKI